MTRRALSIGRHVNFIGLVLLLMAIALVAQTASHISSWAGDTDLLEREAERLAAQWAAEYTDNDLLSHTPIRLGFSRAFSAHFTKAAGKTEINFRTGHVTISVDGLAPLPEGAVYEVWLVENAEGVGNTAAVDFGEDGDRILNLGALPANGSLTSEVSPEKLAGFRVDLAAVMLVDSGQKPEFVIGEMARR